MVRALPCFVLYWLKHLICMYPFPNVMYAFTNPRIIWLFSFWFYRIIYDDANGGICQHFRSTLSHIFTMHTHTHIFGGMSNKQLRAPTTLTPAPTSFHVTSFAKPNGTSKKQPRAGNLCFIWKFLITFEWIYVARRKCFKINSP